MIAIMRSKLLNEELINTICEIIEKGNFAKTAIQATGISESSYYRWLKQGQEDSENDVESIERKFWESVKQAEARSEIELIERVKEEPTGNRWLLARRFRDRFGDRLEVDHTGKTEIEIVWPEEE